MSESDRLVLSEVLKQQHQSNRPALPLNDYFQVFSAEQILKSLGFDLDLTQIESGIVGGGNEGGLDSFYLFANKRLIREDTALSDFKDQQLNIELVLVQSKNQASFAESAILKFRDFADNCLKFGVDLTQASKILYSERLLSSVARFHAIYKPAQRPTLKIAFYYATIGEYVDRKVTTRRDLLVTRLQELYSTAQCSCDFVGASSLWKWFNQPVTGPLVLECSKSIAWPKLYLFAASQRG
jgi:hypothetical protein